jgi:hypothetical protein
LEGGYTSVGKFRRAAISSIDDAKESKAYLQVSLFYHSLDLDADISSSTILANDALYVSRALTVAMHSGTSFPDN